MIITTNKQRETHIKNKRNKEQKGWIPKWPTPISHLKVIHYNKEQQKNKNNNKPTNYLKQQCMYNQENQLL